MTSASPTSRWPNDVDKSMSPLRFASCFASDRPHLPWCGVRPVRRDYYLVGNSSVLTPTAATGPELPLGKNPIRFHSRNIAPERPRRRRQLHPLPHRRNNRKHLRDGPEPTVHFSLPTEPPTDGRLTHALARHRRVKGVTSRRRWARHAWPHVGTLRLLGPHFLRVRCHRVASQSCCASGPARTPARALATVLLALVAKRRSTNCSLVALTVDEYIATVWAGGSPTASIGFRFDSAWPAHSQLGACPFLVPQSLRAWMGHHRQRAPTGVGNASATGFRRHKPPANRFAPLARDAFHGA
jgi:hypothetical protein